MTKAPFLHTLLGLYREKIRHIDDYLIIVTHWCFVNKGYMVIDGGEVKNSYKINRFILMYSLRRKSYLN